MATSGKRVPQRARTAKKKGLGPEKSQLGPRKKGKKPACLNILIDDLVAGPSSGPGRGRLGYSGGMPKGE